MSILPLWLIMSAFAGIGDKKGANDGISSPNARHADFASSTNWRGPAGFRRAPADDQRPVSRVPVWSAVRTANVTTIPLVRRLPGASNNLPERQIRTDLGFLPRRSYSVLCSRWGLPVPLPSPKRGALLPHRFTLPRLNATRRGGLFSVALLSWGFIPAGRYPAPFVRGAGLSSPAAFRRGMERPSGRPRARIGMGARVRCVKSRRATALKRP